MKLAKFALTPPLVAICVALFAATTSFGAFKYQSTLTVGGYAGEETLDGFPLLVRVPATVAEKCQADGRDIVFTSADGATTFAHEIDEWDASGESLVWVKVPLAKGMAFTMKFGDDAATASTENPAAVWSDYTAVWHLNETEGAGTTDFAAYDSTDNGLDLAATTTDNNEIANMVSVSGAFGESGVARQIGSKTGWTSGNSLQNDNLTAWDAIGNTFSVSAWVKWTDQSTGNNQIMMFSRHSGPRSNLDTDGWLIGAAENLFYQCGQKYSTRINGPTRAHTETWHYVTFVYEGESGVNYYDGKKAYSGTISAAQASTYKFKVGGPGGHLFAGMMDEIRIRSGVTEKERVAAEYANMTVEDYIAFGPIEEISSGDTLVVIGENGDYGTVSPAYGKTAVTPGEVVCTASGDVVVVSDDEKAQIVGWALKVVDADGKLVSETSGEGLECKFVHVAGCVDTLTWKMSSFYRVTAASSSELGTVSIDPVKEFFAKGESVKLTATAVEGYHFTGWAGDVPEGRQKENPLNMTVEKVSVLAADFAETKPLTFIATEAPAENSASQWNDALNWEDQNMPAADGSDSVIVKGKKASGDYYITLNNNSAVYGITFTGTGRAHFRWYDSRLVIGAGGITVAEGTTTPFIESAFTMASSFAIQATGDMSLTRDNREIMTTNPDNVLEFDGPYTMKLGNAVYVGKYRTNASLETRNGAFAANGFEIFDSDGLQPVSTKALAYNYEISSQVRQRDAEISPKFTISQTRDLPICFNMKGNGLQYERESVYAFSGGFSGAAFYQLRFSGNSLPTLFPNVHRVTFEGDGSGLSTGGTVQFENFVADVDHKDAFGVSNARQFIIGENGLVQASLYALSGLRLGAGVSADGDVVCGNVRPDWYFSFSSMMVGGFEAGRCDFNGKLSNPKVTKTWPGHPESLITSPLFFEFFAPAGGEVHFNGDVSGFDDYKPYVLGGGDVHFAAANANWTKAPIVRAGRLLVGEDAGVGSGTIELGEACSQEPVEVRAVLPMTVQQNSKLGLVKNGDGFTTSGLVALYFDDVDNWKAGDRFVIANLTSGQYAGIYEFTSATEIKRCYELEAKGSRVKVLEGTNFGGKTLFKLNDTLVADSDTKNYPLWHLESMVANPVCGLIADGAATIANDVIVNDSAAILGGATTDASTFSGSVVLSNDVTFAAVEGGTVSFTGEIDNTDGHDVSFAGFGMVHFVRGLDVDGCAITVTVPTQSVPVGELKKWTIASGLTGTPASIKLKTDDGSAVPEDWNVHKVGSKLVFKNKLTGTILLFR